jgi:hypothetical protein
MPVAAASAKPGTPEMPEAASQDQSKDPSKDQTKAEPETRSLPVATMAAEKPAAGESRPDISQTKP